MGGTQAKGAEMERPSESSTVSVSSVTDACIAVTDRASTVDVFMPAIQQVLLVHLDDLLYLVELLAGECPASPQPHRIEPELRLAVVALDVDVRWLIPVAGIAKEPVRPAAKHGRHCARVQSDPLRDNTKYLHAGG